MAVDAFPYHAFFDVQRAKLELLPFKSLGKHVEFRRFFAA